LYSKLAARPESEENEKLELLCGSDDLLDECDAQPEEFQEALSSESSEDSGPSSDLEPDSDTSTEPADAAESQAPEDDDLGFDLEYFGPKRGRKYQMSVDRRNSEHITPLKRSLQICHPKYSTSKGQKYQSDDEALYFYGTVRFKDGHMRSQECRHRPPLIFDGLRDSQVPELERKVQLVATRLWC
jgi:hypothetical protein